MMKGKTALVTGASSGIGWAVAARLSAAGAAVHAAARRGDRLSALQAECGAIPHVLDMTDTAAIERLGAEIQPDLLINNAGLGAGIAGLASATAAEIEQTVAVNVAGLMHCLRVFLPGMIARKTGHVVNIGSVAGLHPVASALYGGTKGAVRMLTQNLRNEMRGTGVRVTEICPGRVATEFYDAALADQPALRDRAKDTGIRELQPSDVGEAVLYAVAAPRHVNVSTIELQPLEQSYGGVSFDPVDWPEPS